MTGTKAGGIKCRETNYKKYGKDFYKNMGRKGGIVCCRKGFATNLEAARKYGRIGGLKSKRGKAHESK